MYQASLAVMFALLAVALWRAFAAGREVDHWHERLAALEREVERARTRLGEPRASR